MSLRFNPYDGLSLRMWVLEPDKRTAKLVPVRKRVGNIILYQDKRDPDFEVLEFVHNQAGAPFPTRMYNQDCAMSIPCLLVSVVEEQVGQPESALIREQNGEIWRAKWENIRMAPVSQFSHYEPQHFLPDGGDEGWQQLELPETAQELLQAYPQLYKQPKVFLDLNKEEDAYAYL